MEARNAQVFAVDQRSSGISAATLTNTSDSFR
jgi:hypothetical protein